MSLHMAIQLTHGFIFKEFASYGQFKHYHQSVEDSSHYEIIEGNQCLYFDFDGETDIPGLVVAIRKQLEKYDIIINVYSSSDRIKTSYHVVVKGVYFKDHIACGQVAKEIMSSLGGEWVKSFDATVYSVKRNLRLLGSRKIDSTRIKVFHSVAYKSENFASTYENDPLYMSMVICVGGCRLVDIVVPTETLQRSLINTFSTIDMTPSEANIAFTLVCDLMPGIFSKREVRGKSLFLKRERSGMCPLCERIHDSDCGVVSLRGTGYFFMCFRDTTVSLPLQEDIEVFLPTIDEEPTMREKSAIEIYAAKMVKKYRFSSARS